MERNNGLPLALVKSAPEQETSAETPLVMSTICTSCGGLIVERRHGTIYCCAEAELAMLRAVIDKLDQQLAAELEDPPSDAHTARFLAYTRGRVHRARRLKPDA